MVYFLAIETKQNEFEAIRIPKNGSTGTYENTLNEIDQYTTAFSDELKLRHELFSKGVLTYNHYFYPLAIIEKNSLEGYKVKDNILFSDSKNFIENPEQVIEYLIDKYRDGDIDFFNLLLSIETIDFKTIAKAFADSINNRLYNAENEEILRKKTQCLVYSRIQDNTRNLVTKENINYNALRTIASIISEYELSLSNRRSNKKTRKNTSK